MIIVTRTQRTDTPLPIFTIQPYDNPLNHNNHLSQFNSFSYKQPIQDIDTHRLGHTVKGGSAISVCFAAYQLQLVQ